MAGQSQVWVERSAELAQVPPFSQGKVEQGLVRWQTKPWKLAVQVQVKLERSTLLVQVAPLSTDVHGSSEHGMSVSQLSPV